MANNDFKKLIGSDVTFLYPRLDQPYRWDNTEKKTVPCKAAASMANWNITFSLPKERGEELIKVCTEHFKSCKGKAKFGGVFGLKIDAETGEHHFRAKRNCTTKAGDLSQEPVVRDKYGRMLDAEGRKFWTGSRGDIRVMAFPSTDPDGKNGISLLLDTVVVREAKYQDGDADFEFESLADLPTDDEEVNDNDGDIFDEDK